MTTALPTAPAALAPHVSDFQDWLHARNAHLHILRPLNEIERLFQPFFRRHGVSLEPNAPPYRVPYTCPPPYPASYGDFLEATANASFHLTHSSMGRAAEFGRIMWALTNQETVDLLFAIQTIWDPIYHIDECNLGEEAHEEEARSVFGRGQYVWWPELQEALGFRA